MDWLSREHSRVQGDQDTHYHFGPVNIPLRRCDLFVVSELCVKQKSILPGYLLLVPKRSDVACLVELTAKEGADCFLAVQRDHKVTDAHFSCSALGWAP